MRPLGKNQIGCLESLIEFKGWHPHCRWTWSNTATTTRIMAALEKRGLVRLKAFRWCQDTVYGYVATAEGKKMVKK